MLSAMRFRKAVWEWHGGEDGESEREVRTSIRRLMQ